MGPTSSAVPKKSLSGGMVNGSGSKKRHRSFARSGSETVPPRYQSAGYSTSNPASVSMQWDHSCVRSCESRRM